MSIPQLSTAPTTTPIDLADARAACKLTGQERDAELGDWINLAVDRLQSETWRQFCTAIYTLNFDNWADEMILPNSPLASVGSVLYYDPDSDQQTLATSVYEVVTDQLPGFIRLKYNQTWPSVRGHPDDITVTYPCGEAVTDVPVWIKHATRLLVAHYYTHGEAAEIPDGVLALLDRVGEPV